MSTVIKVEEHLTRVTVNSTGQHILVKTEEVKLVTVGKVGPSGPQGIQGIPGPPGGGTPFVEEDLVGVVPTEFTLAHAPVVGSVALLINGLLQSYNSFSVVGSVVALPGDLLITTGDLLIFSYTY